MCEERSISPHTLHCGTCGEKISAVRKTQVENHTVWAFGWGKREVATDFRRDVSIAVIA